MNDIYKNTEPIVESKGMTAFFQKKGKYILKKDRTQ